MAGWPAGYPSRGAWVFRDVTQDFTYWPNLASLSITQLHPDGLATCTLEVPDPGSPMAFEDGDEHRITFRGSRVWAGHMRNVDRSDMSAHGPRLWHLEGQDYTAVLGYDIIQTGHERDSEPLEDRVAWILTKLTYPGITTTGVDLPNMTVEAATYEGFSVMDALEQVSDEAALHFYVDFDKDLHMFRNEIVPADIDLDDDTPNYSATFPYSDLVHRIDRSQQTNAVFVKGKRHSRWVLDSASISAYGRIESSIIDDTLTTASQVRAAGERRLNQLAEPIVDGRLVCWEPGMYAGRSFQIESVQWPDIDGTYIVTQAEITAPDSHDESGEALMRTEIGYTDRRRVGRFPGSGKDKDKKDSSNTTPDSDPDPTKSVGECCSPVGIGENQLTEASQTIGAYAIDPEDVPVGNFVPPFTYAVGDRVLWWRGQIHPPSTPIVAGKVITTPTFTFISQSSSGRRKVNLYVRDIDGTEPAIWTVAHNTPYPQDEGWVLHVIRNVNHANTDENTDNKTAIGAVSSLTADPVALGYSANSLIIQRLAMYESTDDEGYVSTASFPSGSTPLGAISIGSGAGEDEMWMAVTHGPVQATDPATFGTWNFDAPNAGNIRATAYRVGSPYNGPGEDVPVSLGGVTVTILPGPTWDGGNVGDQESVSSPAVSVDDGVIVLTSSVYDSDYVLRWTGPPDMPTELEDFTIRVPFELDVAGDTGDPGERYLGFIVNLGGQRVSYRVRLGDGVRAQGVEIEGDTATFVAKDITEGEPWYMSFSLSGGVARVKAWEAADPEPDWDLTMTTFDTTTEDDALILDVRLGNDGTPAQTLRIAPLVISGGALPGEAVDWHVVGYGDGTTTTFSTPYPYDELSLQVRVDNQQLLGSAITAMDGAAGTFTLSHAPYGDPSDPTGSSVVEARYVRR